MNPPNKKRTTLAVGGRHGGRAWLAQTAATGKAWSVGGHAVIPGRYALPRSWLLIKK